MSRGGWLRGLRQPIGGTETDTVFRFLLALFAAVALIHVFDLPHELYHLCGKGTAANARRSSCLSNLRQVSFAIDMYCADNNQRLWPRGARSEPMAVALAPYMKNHQILICPSDRSPVPARLSPRYTSYATNDLLLGLPLERVQGEPFVWDTMPWHSNGRNVLTIGSRLTWVRERD